MSDLHMHSEHKIPSHQVEMNDLLQLTVDEGASDLHIAVGLPPMLRLHGGLEPLDVGALTPDDTERLMKSITSPDHQQKVREQGGTDFGFGFGEAARFHGERTTPHHDGFTYEHVVLSRAQRLFFLGSYARATTAHTHEAKTK